MNRQQWQRAIEPAPEDFHRAVAHAEPGRVSVQRYNPAAVVDHHIIAGCAAVGCSLDGSVRRSHNICPCGGSNINSFVVRGRP